MVAVLVVGLLVAIAVPAFLGARSRAQETAARANAQAVARAAIADAAATGVLPEENRLADLGTGVTIVGGTVTSSGPGTASALRAGQRLFVAVADGRGGCQQVETDASTIVRERRWFGTCSAAAANAPGGVADGLDLWLDAADIDGNGRNDGTGEAGVSGGRVSTWTDRSPGARSVSATDGAAPALVSARINGLPAVRFDGATTALDSTANLDLRSGMTAFVVGVNRVRRNYNPMLVVGAPRTAGRSTVEFYWQAGSTGSGNLVVVTDGLSDFAGIQADNTGPTAGSPYVVSTQVSAGAFRLWSNGTTVASGPGPWSPPSGDRRAAVAAPFRLGFGLAMYPVGERFMDGDIAELIVYSRTLSDAERAEVENYLKAKWAV